jgi:hypothetical protein
MTNDRPDEKTQELRARTAETRDRVATDVERLANQLTPKRLKARALDVGERSLHGLAARALQRLAQSPRRLVAYVRRHPAAGAAIFAGGAVVVWRLAQGRRR